VLTVRWAEPGERSRIQRYLFDNMGKIPFERWGNILDCRWIPEDDRYGAVVMEGDDLCGFLGIVFADRPMAGTTHRTGNITSWYLEKDRRRSGLGQEMLALVTSLPDVTYVATSPNPRSGGLLAKVGWDVLEERRFLWHRSDDVPEVEVRRLASPQDAGELDGDSRRILADHAGLNVDAYVLRGREGEACLVVTYVKLKGADVAHHEVLHVSDRPVFMRLVRQFANAVLAPANAVLSLDSRFVSEAARPDEIVRLEVPRSFKPCGTEPHHIDFLYSEVVLLDLKIQ
jgi:RimJ/RimL family protein N-acetyltransferase